MQSRALIMLLIALILGGVAVYLVQQVLQREVEERQIVEKAPDMAQVVVANVDLEVGSRVERVMLTTAPFPRESVPEGAYGEVDAVMGKEDKKAPVVIKEVRKGEVLLPYKLSPPGARAGLTVKIPDDMRAITVSTNEIQGVAGFVLPGDRVDVLHTTTAGRADDDLVTRTLLQNIRVLGIDQISSEQEDEPKVVNAATILVTPKQAQKITLAQQVGQVTLALRNERDVDELTPEVIRLVDLQTPEPAQQPRPVRRAVAQPKKPAAPPKPTRTKVEVIRGLEVEEEDVKIDEDAEQEAAGGQQ